MGLSVGVWKEIKKIKGRNTLCSNNVDGKRGEENIAHVFNVQYNSLYNSVPYESFEIKEIQQEIDRRFGVEGFTNEINVNHIRDAIAKLKNGKNGGEEGLFSESMVLTY